jgi:polysaccharide chain length determinant protein (PEP-CTERM system associated)
MEKQQRQQVKKYLDLLFFHWKLLVACLLAATTIGLAVYLRMPKLYQCKSLLSYERQQINPARMAPERDNQRLRDTISTLSDVVISRNNLEDIIKQFDLYHDARQQLPIEDVIDGMRRHIKISPSSRGDTFTVVFDGRDQEKVMKVTNALAAKFIEENLKYREARATETSKYTQDELDMAKAVLDEKEQLMRDYKLKHYNEMPEQRESNLARLNSLHEQYQGIQDSIQDLERTKVMAQEQLNLRKRLSRAMESVATANTTPSGPRQEEPISPWQRLQQLYSYLEVLQVKYTDKHPEIRRTKQLIARLEASLEGQKPSSGTTKSPRRRQVQDPEVAQLQFQLKDISLNINKLKEDQKTIRSEIEKYEKWIAAAPVREAEWNTLTRDYDELRRHYDYLVSQNLQASSVEHLERKQKGSKFKIVDSAGFPDKPYKPNFFRIMLVALGVGLGGAAGLVFARDFLDTSFRDPSEIEAYLDIPVISSVPYLEQQSEVAAKRLKTVLWSGGFLLYSAVLLTALAYFWLQGKIIL